MILTQYLDVLKQCKKEWKKILLLALLNYVPLVNFIVIGYFITAIQNYLQDRNRLEFPEIQNPWHLFIEGSKLSLIGIAWVIPAAAVFGLGMLIGLLFFQSLLLTIVFGILTGVLALITVYLLPAIFLLESFSFGKSFSKHTFKVAFHGVYLKHWILIMIVNIPFIFLGKLFPLLIPLIGVVWYMIIARVFATVYLDLRGSS